MTARSALYLSYLVWHPFSSKWLLEGGGLGWWRYEAGDGNLGCQRRCGSNLWLTECSIWHKYEVQIMIPSHVISDMVGRVLSVLSQGISITRSTKWLVWCGWASSTLYRINPKCDWILLGEAPEFQPSKLWPKGDQPTYLSAKDFVCFSSQFETSNGQLSFCSNISVFLSLYLFCCYIWSFCSSARLNLTPIYSGCLCFQPLFTSIETHVPFARSQETLLDQVGWN